MVANIYALLRPERWAPLRLAPSYKALYANFIALARPVINNAASVSNAAMLR